MAPAQVVFHALMRPAIIQILRAAGFHSAKPTVIDSLTDIAHRYLELICQETARHTTDNTLDPMFAGDVAPTIVELRLALQDIGAFLPERDWEEQDFMEQEDTRGVDEFLSWATGPKTELIKKIALDDDGEEGVTDYLSALKKRHSKTADDSKYIGTLLGRAPDQGHVTVEGGGEINSIQAWIDQRRAPAKSPEPEVESRPASSGLSSVGTMADEMDLGA